MNKKAVLCLSGGLDSTVLLAELLAQGFEVHALAFYYGQRHSREIYAARSIYAHYKTLGAKLLFREMNLEHIACAFFGSALTSDRAIVPDGHYESETMKQTVVPNRNMVLLSIATAYAISIGAQCVAYAAHAGDHAIYADCRTPFIHAMQNAIRLADDNAPQLFAPFKLKEKHNIVTLGKALQVPFSLTWSCYKGGTVHCGKCATCVERQEAFFIAGVEDSTNYEDNQFWQSVSKLAFNAEQLPDNWEGA